MDGTYFFFNKKNKKSNTIVFESVPLNIKISVFIVKKGHTFSGFRYMPKYNRIDEYN